MAKRTKPAAKRATRGGRGGASEGPSRAGGRSPKAAGPPRNPTPLAQFCRTLPGTTEDIKWEDDLVFSVAGKMYAAFDIENSDELGFKCDDVEFERLTRIDGIIPAPYAARFGWVKVTRRGALPLPELKRLIRRSYDLVIEKLPAKTRAALAK